MIMPQMGESIFEGTITKWLKKPGDTVQQDEPLFEISTDKVDAEIPSPAAGVLSEIKVAGRHHGPDQHRRGRHRRGRGSSPAAPKPAPQPAPACSPRLPPSRIPKPIQPTRNPENGSAPRPWCARSPGKTISTCARFRVSIQEVHNRSYRPSDLHRRRCNPPPLLLGLEFDQDLRRRWAETHRWSRDRSRSRFNQPNRDGR